MRNALAIIGMGLLCSFVFGGPGYYGGGDYTEYYRNGWTYSFGYPGPYPGKVAKNEYESGRGFFRGNRKNPKHSIAAPSKELPSQVLPPAPEDPTAAMLVITVPEKAELWVDSKKSDQKGGNRFIYTPPLKPGRAYGYKLKAVWEENGEEIIRERDVIFLIGETVNVQLTK